MANLKILHLLKSSRFSGAENVVFQIIDMFKDDNIEMAYCSRDGQIREMLARQNINFYPIEKLCLKELKRVIDLYQPNIIHAHDTMASVIAAFFSRRITVISHMHVNHESMRRINLKTILYLACSTKFKHIFWVSYSSFNDFIFRKQIAKKSSVLYNVMNREMIIKKMEEDKTDYFYDIVYVGRLTYQKNPEKLMRVLRLVLDANPKLKVAIVGTGDLLEETKKMSIELNIVNNVFFLGFKENPLKILHDAKVMVMTSRFEGTPISALEAMALGVPIVSTPTDGLKDLIEDGITGYLSNDDRKLAEYCIRIINDSELHKELSINTQNCFINKNQLDEYKCKIQNQYVELPM